ncbi:MAG: helix-turn-helix domain-containing protein [Oceanobacter sp.]
MSFNNSVVVSTRDLPPEEKGSFWIQQVQQYVVEVDCPSNHQMNFDASLRHLDSGDLGLNWIRASAHAVHRSSNEIRRKQKESIFMCLMLEGHGFSYQGTQCANHAPGDIVLYDTAKPYGHGFDDNMEMLVVDIPKVLFEDCIAPWQHGSIVKLDRDAYIGDASSGKVQRLLSRASLDATSAQGTNEQVLNQLRQLLGHRTLARRSRPRQQLLQRSLEYIEQNLGWEDLNTDQICSALKATPKQLSRAFDIQGITVSRYIWNQRLERCREDIIAQPCASLSDIAFKWGFNHCAHFSRSYKKRFDETPSQTRSRARH